MLSHLSITYTYYLGISPPLSPLDRGFQRSLPSPLSRRTKARQKSPQERGQKEGHFPRSGSGGAPCNDVLGSTGWGGRIRTCGTRYQKPLPYHLATPQPWRRYYCRCSGGARPQNAKSSSLFRLTSGQPSGGLGAVKGVTAAALAFGRVKR